VTGHHQQMDLPTAARNFKRSISHCTNVVEIHREAGDGRRGLRTRETSLNRAVIVMAMAAWQGVVENIALTGMDLAVAQAPAGMPLTAWAAVIKQSVERFSTPNAQLSRGLLRQVGFDPAPAWLAMKAPGPQRAGNYEEQLAGWLKVRHAIAHGDATLPDNPILAHVREVTVRQLSSGVAQGAVQPPTDPGLRLKDAVACVTFVQRLTKATGDGFATSVGLPAVDWT
jgi:hypothetical protein